MDYKNQVIITFSVDSFYGSRMGRHNIMIEMSKYFKIVYCNNMVTIDDILKSPKNLRNIKNDVKNINKNLTTFSPNHTIFSTYKYKQFNSIQYKRYKKAVYDCSKINKNKKIIIYIWHPSFYWVLDFFHYDILVYHMYDDYSSYSDVSEDRRAGSIAVQKRIIDKSDIVLSTHPFLLEKYDTEGKGFFVGNGVDFDLFNSNKKVATELAEIRKNCDEILLGYVGRITSKLDIDLLMSISSFSEKIKLVLVGPITNISSEDETKLNILFKRVNVYFLGEKKVEELPTYINGLDICLLPYKIGNNHVHAIYPLKLHEYFACGKQVMATIFNKYIYDEFNENLFWGDGTDWVSYLSGQLKSNTFDEDSDRRIEVARDNSWKNRVDFIINKLSKVSKVSI